MRMKYRVSLLAAAGWMIVAASNGSASDVKVIANSSVKADSISEDELKSVFLEKRSSLGNGTYVEPVLEKDGVAHDAFLQEYLGRTGEDLQTYYRSLVFTGR